MSHDNQEKIKPKWCFSWTGKYLRLIGFFSYVSPRMKDNWCLHFSSYNDRSEIDWPETSVSSYSSLNPVVWSPVNTSPCALFCIDSHNSLRFHLCNPRFQERQQISGSPGYSEDHWKCSKWVATPINPNRFNSFICEEEEEKPIDWELKSKFFRDNWVRWNKKKDISIVIVPETVNWPDLVNFLHMMMIK